MDSFCFDEMMSLWVDGPLLHVLVDEAEGLNNATHMTSSYMDIKYNDDTELHSCS